MRLTDVVAMHSDPEANCLGWDPPCPATYHLYFVTGKPGKVKVSVQREKYLCISSDEICLP